MPVLMDSIYGLSTKPRQRFISVSQNVKRRSTPNRISLEATRTWNRREVKTDSGLTGKIFMYSRTVDKGTRGNGQGGVERYRHEGIAMEALVHGHGISIMLSFDNRDLKWIDELPKLVNKLVANPGNRIPAEPGCCMDRAYFRDPLPADQRKSITISAGLPSNPDIDFTLRLYAGLKPEERGLLARAGTGNEGLSMAQSLRITRLRAAPREISGFRGGGRTGKSVCRSRRSTCPQLPVGAERHGRQCAYTACCTRNDDR